MKGAIYEIKKGKEQVWRNWCKRLNGALKSEAIQTLREEECIQEFFTMFQIKDVWYTLGMGEGVCKSSDKEKKINLEHDRMKRECLIPGRKIETIYHLKAN